MPGSGRATPIVDDVNVVSVLGYQPHVCERERSHECHLARHSASPSAHPCQCATSNS